MTKIYQHTKTGKLVELLKIQDEEFAMVRDSSGTVSYVTIGQLLPYDKERGRLSEEPTLERKVLKKREEEEKIPDGITQIEDTRLNLNTAPAEIIAKRLPGVGYATAKKVVELRLSLSGERFANLKQLENIPRVNWEQLIKEDLIFIA